MKPSSVSKLDETFPRKLQSGERVMVLLPIPGSSLSAQCFGPYLVKENLGDTDYVICTPDHKRKTRVCQINMLKVYNTHEDLFWSNRHVQ